MAKARSKVAEISPEPNERDDSTLGIRNGSPGFIDAFLLAIIDAHPLQRRGFRRQAKIDQGRQVRLAAARQALFGDRLDQGQPRRGDETLLAEMAKQYLRDRGRISMNRFSALMGRAPLFANQRVRPVRELARDAILSFDSDDSGHRAIAERIRKKFEAKKEGLLERARYSDDVPETIESQILEHLKHVLEPHGIRMKLRVMRGRN